MPRTMFMTRLRLCGAEHCFSSDIRESLFPGRGGSTANEHQDTEEECWRYLRSAEAEIVDGLASPAVHQIEIQLQICLESRDSKPITAGDDPSPNKPPCSAFCCPCQFSSKSRAAVEG